MHVLIAAHDLYPDPGSGGTGRYVYETARRLVERGHRCSVVTRRRGNGPRWERVHGLDVYRYDLAVADRSAPRVLAQLPAAFQVLSGHLAAVFDGQPPDLLSAQGPVTTMLVGALLDDELPRVTTFHSPWPTEYLIRTRRTTRWPRRHLNEALRRRLERRQLATSDRVVTLSASMRGELQAEYGLSLDVDVIPGGVDAERFRPDAGPSPHVTGGSPAFLTVRRLAERMGHERLLEAFGTVVEAYPEAQLYIAGDGPLRGRLERIAAAGPGGDRTTFLGYVPDADLPALYAAADLFVLPTTALEGFGLATVEALASGTPALATPVGGTVEVLAGLADDPAVPGPVLAAADSAGALADLMVRWAGLEGEALAAAGRAGRRHVVDRYPWSRAVSGLVACYQRAVA